MKKIWTFINTFSHTSTRKKELFLGLFMLINLVFGAAIWLVFGRIVLSDPWWLFCFMGYPAIFVGFFGGVIYLYNHVFDEAL